MQRSRKRLGQKASYMMLNQAYIDEWISANLEFSEQKRVGYIIGNLLELVG